MDLGEFFPCLTVADLARSMDFYRRLDFQIVEDHSEDHWAVLQHNNMVLCLYQGHIDQNLINFRGGDVPAIIEAARARGIEPEQDAELHPDGSYAATLRDPDGNAIFFNTFPGERAVYEEQGRLIQHGKDRK